MSRLGRDAKMLLDKELIVFRLKTLRATAVSAVLFETLKSRSLWHG